jgi:anti-sigma regulatory factor (Ser/Thr protein kinase)
MYLPFSLVDAPQQDHEIAGLYQPVPHEVLDSRRRGNPTGTWHLSHEPEAVSEARRLASDAVRSWGVAEAVLDSLELTVSELVTNAVEHARPPIALHVHHVHAGRTLHIEVSDGGPAPCEGEWAESCTPDEQGRGNMIIDALASSHGTYSTPPGSTWWADLPADAAC